MRQDKSKLDNKKRPARSASQKEGKFIMNAKNNSVDYRIQLLELLKQLEDDPDSLPIFKNVQDKSLIEASDMLLEIGEVEDDRSFTNLINKKETSD